MENVISKLHSRIQLFILGKRDGTDVSCKLSLRT